VSDAPLDVGKDLTGIALIPAPIEVLGRKPTANDLAIRRALEFAGVEFIDENGGGAGVRPRKRHQKKR